MVVAGSLKNQKNITHEVEIAPEKGLPISVYSICDWSNDRVTTYLYDEDSDTYIAKKDIVD
ncbi:hypothetical protein UF05_08835 [Vibrio sp. S457-15]|nr:hypothetical protein UF05_08835 [Vibrio sp. S457-15]